MTDFQNRLPLEASTSAEQASTAQKLHINSLGSHHQASLLVDPVGGTVSGGTVLNYSDHGLVGLKINSEGKTIGTFTHTGENHSLKGELDSHGQFRGKYLDKQAGVEIAITSDGARLLRGNPPVGSLTVEGNHHSTQLAIDAEGNLSGRLESKLTNSSAFSIDLQNGKVNAGSFSHRGNHHTTTIRLGQETWQAEVGSNDEDMQWAIAIENGQAGVRGAVNVKHRF